MPRIAITGTPGVGKTRLAALLRERGQRVVDVRAWAAREGCVAGHDALDAADAIDVEALAARMPPDDGSTVFYEGHLSHLLGVDVAWVLRCDPDVLRARLAARGYAPAKVVENLEAEATDIILQEALENVHWVAQRDGTRRTPEQLLKAFAELDLGASKRSDLEGVDWTDRLPIPGQPPTEASEASEDPHGA